MKFLKPLSFLLCFLSFHVVADIVGEQASYVVDTESGRTTWLVTDGSGKVTVTEFREDERLGPSYLLTIEYDLEVQFMGRQKGSIGLLAQEKLFSEQFLEELKTTHPVDLVSFQIDYEGMSSCVDSEDNEYQECANVKIFDVDPSYYPVLLWHESENALGASFENLEIKAKVNNTVPVLGGVQLDVSGVISGFDVSLGLDFVP